MTLVKSLQINNLSCSDRADSLSWVLLIKLLRRYWDTRESCTTWDKQVRNTAVILCQNVRVVVQHYRFLDLHMLKLSTPCDSPRWGKLGILIRLQDYHNSVSQHLSCPSFPVHKFSFSCYMGGKRKLKLTKGTPQNPQFLFCSYSTDFIALTHFKKSIPMKTESESNQNASWGSFWRTGVRGQWVNRFCFITLQLITPVHSGSKRYQFSLARTGFGHFPFLRCWTWALHLQPLQLEQPLWNVCQALHIHTAICKVKMQGYSNKSFKQSFLHQIHLHLGVGLLPYCQPRYGPHLLSPCAAPEQSLLTGW